MIRHGKHAVPLTLGVAAGVPLVFFLVFERWFLVPLPKGPLEALLGCSHGRDQQSSARLRRCTDTAQPGLHADRHRARCADRGAARPGRCQWRGHPAAAYLQHEPYLGHHHAELHLLGCTFRRRHHLHPVQHPGGALERGHHLRWLPDGAAGPRSTGTDRSVHLVVRGRHLRGAAHHLPGAAAGKVRAEIRPRGVLCRAAAHLLQLRGDEQGARRQDHRRHDAGLCLGCCRHGHGDRPSCA